jgi:hypothetical protein
VHQHHQWSSGLSIQTDWYDGAVLVFSPSPECDPLGFLGVAPQCATRDGRRMLGVLNVRHVHDLGKHVFIDYLSIRPLAADAKHVTPQPALEPTAALPSSLAVAVR